MVSFAKPAPARIATGAYTLAAIQASDHPIALVNVLANEAGIDDERMLLAAVLHTPSTIPQPPSKNWCAFLGKT